MRRNQRGHPWNKAVKAQLERAFERKWSAPALIAYHRQALSLNPGDLDARYMLANCLYEDGQPEAAESEWERVVQTGDATWADMVRETRALLGRDQENR